MLLDCGLAVEIFLWHSSGMFSLASHQSYCVNTTFMSLVSCYLLYPRMSLQPIKRGG